MNIDYLTNNIHSLNIEYFNINQIFLNTIYIHIRDENFLGEGVLGKVYGIPDSNIAIKVTKPCVEESLKIGMEKLYCDNMKTKNQIIYIPNIGKILIIIANYLSEGIIGGFINKIQDQTPNFVQTYGMYFSRFRNESYMLMEKISTDIHNKLKTKKDIYLLLFQIAQSLSVAQQVYKFTHFDLHIKNIGYVNFTGELTYNINESRKIVMVNPGFLVKIFDFGFSRIEGETFILNPLEDEDHGIYNQYHDFMSFIGSLFFFEWPPKENYVPISPFNLLDDDEKNELFSMVFNEPITADDAITKYYILGKLKHSDIQPIGHSFSTTRDILNWLIFKLIGLGSIEDRSTYYENAPYYENISNIPERLLINIYDEQEHKIDDGIINIINIRRDFPWRSFNFTNKKPIDVFNKTLVIHMSYIDTQSVLNNGYKFGTFCCKIDPMNFMENYYGVAINGGFFDVDKTYEMFGSYRQFINDHYYESNNDVPNLYYNYYGFIIIDDNGISIGDLKTDVSQVQNAFISGPLLIWDGNPLITEDTLNKTEYLFERSVNIFQCKSNESPSDSKIIDDKFNCDRISPGELSHGSNPNPRTMLIIKDSPYDIIFVVVEGRNNNSDGADFLDLIDIAQRLNAKYAINLDGGTSSNMALRSPDNPNIIEVSNRINVYPVGNILAVIK